MTGSNTLMRWTMTLPALLLAGTSAFAQDAPVDLRDAIASAMTSHPEINQAEQNKQAIEFERKQAQGQFLPRISVEGSAGVRRLGNETRRGFGIAKDTLYPGEGGFSIEQILFEFRARAAQV